jgi:alpha-glucuronidase
MRAAIGFLVLVIIGACTTESGSNPSPAPGTLDSSSTSGDQPPMVGPSAGAAETGAFTSGAMPSPSTPPVAITPSSNPTSTPSAGPVVQSTAAPSSEAPSSASQPATPDAPAPASANPSEGSEAPGCGGSDDDYPVGATPPAAEDGSQLWLRYPEVANATRLAEYQAAFTSLIGAGDSLTLQAASLELVRGISGLTGQTLATEDALSADGAIVIGTPESSALIAGLALGDRLSSLGAEGYLVESTQIESYKVTVVAANSDVGVLYGSFALLRRLQMHCAASELSLASSPRIAHRILDHWDNLDGSVERGYAGHSLWDWGKLPGTLSQRYQDYARANASLGINGAVLNNVNADVKILTPEYLDKVQALADVFRSYGIAVYLTARFSAPIEIGGLSTADPNDTGVAQWWADKASEIYDRIPDFGGFLVKANSEGQPGPGDYMRTHAEGANVLAKALAPHGGIVMWRAFVYSSTDSDRIRQAYDEFKPLDGQFDSNVLLQVKNGPLDFQPREPFSPLFGAMPKTPLALEVQVTKEYTGEDAHLAYLGPLYEEVLDSDTYASGSGSTVAKVIDGSLHGYSTTAIAGVANVGSDSNWTGSHFNQANWYAFGRLAWDPGASSGDIADEWVRQTFTNDPTFVSEVTQLMMGSRQALVNYMTPLGLAHIMASTHHYGPGPWVDDQSRPEWNPVYYHKADMQGIGFDRTSTGSNAVEQYFDPVKQQLGSRDSVPDDFLLFFHHVGWQERLGSGRTLWEELVYRYSLGVDSVAEMRNTWAALEGRIDAQRFSDVSDMLQIQHYEARWWRDACLQYFSQFSGQEVPSGYAAPAQDLSFYKALTCPPDVTKPRCEAVYTGTPSPAITSAASVAPTSTAAASALQ